MDQKRLIDISNELRGIADTGIMYSRNRFDTEHYTKIKNLAAELVSSETGLSQEEVLSMFEGNPGYPTPKCDVRTVVFDKEDKLLMVKDYDGKWTLPGGWCDYDRSASENAIKEVYEEAGITVKSRRLSAVYDYRKHNYPDSFFNSYKFFIECEYISGEFTPNTETTDSKYCTLDEIKELDINTHKANLEQIALCFEAHKADIWETYYD